MKCGHCKSEHLTVAQVKLCARRQMAVSKPPPGRYAVFIPDPNDQMRGKMRFFVVGEHTFREQAGPDFYPVRIGRTRHEIIQAIMVDPDGAMRLYGQTLKLCAAPRGRGTCGLPLTDELSRSRGIGPKCWERLYG